MPANGASRRTFDPATTQAMLNAFDAAQSECRTIQSGVDSARAQLAGSWKGGASAKFDGSMQQWMQGFAKVQQALNQLNESMGYYRQVTTSVESNNVSTGNWALG
jgi:WXG100 family type VII secretion target